MEIVNIEQLMRDKLNECDEWLNGKDEAVARLDEAEKAYEIAKAEVAQYSDEYIAEVVSYRDDLKCRLGIVDEVVEAHDEVVEQPIIANENATDEIIEQPLI